MACVLDVACGWENQWDPPEVSGCVDPRGCKLPPPRNSRIWGSYEDLHKDRENPLDVGNVYWYSCRTGGFEMYGGTIVSHIELTCINDPTGGSSPPYWDPPYDHVFNPFPKCVPMRKYWYSLNCISSEQKHGKAFVSNQ